MTQMVGQLLAAICAAQVVIKIVFGYRYVYVVTPALFHITVDLLGLSGPVCLLLTRYVWMDGDLEMTHCAVPSLFR